MMKSDIMVVLSGFGQMITVCLINITLVHQNEMSVVMFEWYDCGHASVISMVMLELHQCGHSNEISAVSLRDIDAKN